MKKVRILCLVFLFLLVFTSCDTAGKPSDTAADTTTENAEQTQDIHVTDTLLPKPVTTEPSTDPSTEENLKKETPKTLKVLAIGNSFSTDGMEYLYDIAKSAGVQEIVLGNLYIGGCSLQTHYGTAKTGEADYTYYKNTNGSWNAYKGKTMLDGLKDEKWDYISLQQTSKTSGLIGSYGSVLTALVKFVEENKTNADAKLVWHMTWAYQQDSTHSSFPNYDNSQQKMYDMIIDAVKQCILKVPEFEIIIPTGTSIQNVRTSFIGDRITRDGYHLNYTLGRYIAGLTWYAAITGASIDDITYNPAPGEITAEVMAMAKASVNDAIKTPYGVTQSTFTTGTWKSATVATNKTEVNAADCYEADRALALTLGVEIEKYELFTYEYKENSYWYCTKGYSLTTPSSSGSTYQQNVCTAKAYSIEEIPVNSIVICDAGWQYRPELWVSLSNKAETRPGFISANITLLDTAFWGTNQYFAFNISSSPKSNISACYAAAVSHVRVYVPKK